VISQATRRLVGGLFELADLGPRRLKGFAEPLSAGWWKVKVAPRAGLRRSMVSALRHWWANGGRTNQHARP
jgi:hypothetical protein